MAKRFMGINPAHKGFCTPMTKSTCTPRRKALARTLKKHHGFHKKQAGGAVETPSPMPEVSATRKKRSKLPKRMLGGKKAKC